MGNWQKNRALLDVACWIPREVSLFGVQAHGGQSIYQEQANADRTVRELATARGDRRV